MDVENIIKLTSEMKISKSSSLPLSVHQAHHPAFKNKNIAKAKSEAIYCSATKPPKKRVIKTTRKRTFAESVSLQSNPFAVKRRKLTKRNAKKEKNEQTNPRKRRYHFRCSTTTKKRKLECQECKQIFQSEHALKTHIGMMHKEKDGNKCNICSQKFRHPNELHKHLKQRHMVATHDLFDCLHCSQVFKNWLALSQHMGKIHPDPTSKNCSHCSAKFRRPSELLKHLIEVHCTSVTEAEQQESMKQKEKEMETKQMEYERKCAKERRESIKDFHQILRDAGFKHWTRGDEHVCLYPNDCSEPSCPNSKEYAARERVLAEQAKENHQSQTTKMEFMDGLKIVGKHYTTGINLQYIRKSSDQTDSRIHNVQLIKIAKNSCSNSW